MDDRLILALDTNSLQKASDVIDEVKDYIGFFKVGSQLFTANGPKAIELVKKKGCKVFLDLKFHDIPNTVEEAIREAANFEVEMLTIHILGGEEAIRKSVEVAGNIKKITGQHTLIIGITLLTSLDILFLKKIGVKFSLKEFVINLARLGKENGLDGVVASSNETKRIRKEFGPDFVVVTPGIRLDDGKIKDDDQKRISTPLGAIKNGSSYLVIGRPILEAKDKKVMARRIFEEINYEKQSWYFGNI